MKLSFLYQLLRKRAKKLAGKKDEESELKAKEAEQENLFNQSDVMPDRGPTTDIRSYSHLPPFSG